MDEDIGLGSQVNRVVSELVAERLPSVDLAHGDLTCGEQGPEQHRSSFGGRQNCLGLDAALELLMEPFDRIGGARTLLLAERQPGKREEPITGFLEAVGHRFAFEPPFAEEGASTLGNLGR